MSLNYRDNAIRLLAAGYSNEFAEFCAADEQMHEIMMDLAEQFVEKNIPIVDEEAASDVAIELFMGVTCRPV